MKTLFNYTYLLPIIFFSGLTGIVQKGLFKRSSLVKYICYQTTLKKEIPGVSSSLTSHLNSKRLFCISVIIIDNLICHRCFEGSVEIAREKKKSKKQLLKYFILKLSEESKSYISLFFNSYFFSFLFVFKKHYNSNN